MNSLAVGIDIGGTNTSFGIVDRSGRVLSRGMMKTTGHYTVHGFIQTLQKNIHPLMQHAGAGAIEGIGVGAPNANFFTGEIAYAANLPWEGIIPMAKLLETALEHRVVITNDANATALGEMLYGRARGMKDFILVTLGTGVGSGFVSNGQVIYGHDGFAGELGHMIAVREGRKCGCGRTGCLETYASATGIVRTAKEWLTERSDVTPLRDVVDLTAHNLHEAAIKGDRFALDIFEFTGEILGRTLADAVAIVSPEAIIFFGGLAKAGAFILEPAQRYMEQNLLQVYRNKISFLQSSLKDADAAILGASALIWK